MGKGLLIPFGIAGLGVGMGVIGESIGSEGLVEGGEAATGFIKPAINIAMGGLVIRQLKELKEDTEKKEKKKVSGLLF